MVKSLFRQHFQQIHINNGCVTINITLGSDYHPDPVCLHSELVVCSKNIEPEGVGIVAGTIIITFLLQLEISYILIVFKL